MLDGEREILLNDDEKRREMAMVSTQSKTLKSFKDSRGQLVAQYGGLVDPLDPLGLMRWGDTVRETSWLTIRIVGVGGFIGALIWWAAKTWHSELDLASWTNAWWDRMD